MLKKNELNKIAAKFGWEYKEIKNAVKELIESPTIIDCEGFLRECAGADHPIKRYNLVEEFLFQTLNGDPVKVFCDLIYMDPCFQAMALFNFYELIPRQVYDPQLDSLTDEPSFKNNKSFIQWYTDVPYVGINPIYETIEDEAYGEKRDILDSEKFFELYLYKNYLSAELLTYKFLDKFVIEIQKRDVYKNKPKIKGGLIVPNPKTTQIINVLEDMLVELFEKVGFLAFNIKIFRMLASSTFHDPYLSIDLFKELKDSLNDPLLSQYRITDRRYWLIYVLVEKLKGTYGLRGSFRHIGKSLYQAPGSVQRRYFDKKKEAKIKKLSLKDIIREHHLYIQLNEVLKKEI